MTAMVALQSILTNLEQHGVRFLFCGMSPATHDAFYIGRKAATLAA